MNQIMQHDFGGGSSPVAGHYCAKSLGTPFKVYLANGVERGIDPVSGKSVPSIRDLPGLIAAVVQARVLHPRKLSGPDLKYIRSALCLKSKTLAADLDLTAEHYSRCETGPKTMSVATEKQYRMYVFINTVCKDKSLQNLSQNRFKDITPEKAKETFAAFYEIFSKMKIHPVRGAANEELVFVFVRESREWKRAKLDAREKELKAERAELDEFEREAARLASCYEPVAPDVNLYALGTDGHWYVWDPVAHASKSAERGPPRC